MINTLKTRLLYCESDELIAVSTIIDPRFKLPGFLNRSTKGQEALTKLRHELREVEVEIPRDKLIFLLSY